MNILKDGVASLGITRKDPQYLREYRRLNRERINANKREWRKSPQQRYESQKLTAEQRGVPWEFTFEDWWTLWEPHWENRGKAKGKTQMCRYEDSGPYCKANVYFDTLENNVSYSHITTPRWS